ncbi:hypothetical protein PQR75_16210 [Paraburkholderia fungorum]|uniref:aromatic-ring hydroxylase C-terminal domain-containing protein n=1 Tax=Paraburkholderia TaxID=1822464 RepID=UPI0038BCC391
MARKARERAGLALRTSAVQELAMLIDGDPVLRMDLSRAITDAIEVGYELGYAPIKAVFSVEGAENPVAAGIARFKDPGPEGAKARQAAEKALELKNREFNAQGVEMNQQYSSSAVIPDGQVGAEEWKRDQELYLQATTRPGAKIPHAWLIDKHGNRVSTLDVTGKGKFTLVTGLSGGAWVKASEELGLPFLRMVVTGANDSQDPYCDWQRVREVSEAGALLVRPDGYVAWRQSENVFDASMAKGLLQSALSDVLGKAWTGPPNTKPRKALRMISTIL